MRVLGDLALVGLLGVAAAQGRAAGELPAVTLPDQSKATFHRDGLHSVHMLFWRRPTLVLSWRADDAETVEKVVPAVLQLARDTGEDRAVLFVERSGTSYLDMLRLAARRRWLGGGEAWTCEVPPGTESRDTPSFVLTSATHATVLAGHPLADHEALGAAVKRAVDERRSGSADLTPEAREVLRALHEDRLAAALQLVARAGKLRASGKPGDARAADALDAVARQVEGELTTRISWPSEMLAVGTGAAAVPRVEALCKALEPLPNDDRWRSHAEGDLQLFTCGDKAEELKASAVLLKLQGQLFAKGPSESLAKALVKLAASHPGTHAANRARDIAALAAP